MLTKDFICLFITVDLFLTYMEKKSDSINTQLYTVGRNFLKRE